MKIHSRTEDSRIEGTLEGKTFKGEIYIKGGSRLGSIPGIYSVKTVAPIAVVRKIARDQSSDWKHYGLNFLG